MVQNALALCGVLHVSQNPGGRVAVVRLSINKGNTVHCSYRISVLKSFIANIFTLEMEMYMYFSFEVISICLEH